MNVNEIRFKAKLINNLIFVDINNDVGE